jgi:hypothetical protein
MTRRFGAKEKADPNREPVAPLSVGIKNYPACTGEIGWKRYVWFGGDPISNITVGIRPLRGVSG